MRFEDVEADYQRISRFTMSILRFKCNSLSSVSLRFNRPMISTICCPNLKLMGIPPHLEDRALPRAYFAFPIPHTDRWAPVSRHTRGKFRLLRFVS